MEGESGTYILTLFVSGGSVHTERAVRNIRRICEEGLDRPYELEVVDVLERPERAEEASILATPTLIKQLPPPLRRVIGDLSDRESVLVGLDLKRRAAVDPGG